MAISRAADCVRLNPQRANGDLLSVFEAIGDLQRYNSGVAKALNDVIAALPWTSVRLEMSPIIRRRLDLALELVLLPGDAGASDGHDVHPDKAAERALLPRPEDHGVPVLEAIDGSSKLVTPCPLSGTQRPVSIATYTDIKRFVLGAPPEQVAEFWRRVGSEIERICCYKKTDKRAWPCIWVSASGLDGQFLYMSIASTSAHYRFQEFARTPTSLIPKSRKRNNDSDQDGPRKRR